MNANQLLALRNIDKILQLVSTNKSNRKDYNIYVQDVCHNMVKWVTKKNNCLTKGQMILLNKFHREFLARKNYASPDEWFARDQ